MKTAKDIANPHIVYIDGLATVRQAIELMKKEKTDALIIQKRDETDANGIVVLSDIMRSVIVPDKNPDEVSVYEIMTKPLISIPATLNVRYVPRLLVNAKINIAPVEAEGHYIGLIHLRDILYSI